MNYNDNGTVTFLHNNFVVNAKIGNKYDHQLCETIEEDLEEYIDPSELGGCCGGHWADENMIPTIEED